MPLAVNTILLGRLPYFSCYNFRQTHKLYVLGLAVLPTWIVIRGHVPIEHREEASNPMTKRDEEEVVQSVPAQDKGEAVIAQAAVAT